MVYGIAADLLVLIHFAFILFVVFGGLLVLKWTQVTWLHLPCLVWGIMIEWQGWICPLTPLEIRFRQMAGERGYTGGFIDHYIMPLVYPAGLTRDLQFSLAVSLLAFNLLVYGYFVLLRLRSKRG